MCVGGKSSLQAPSFALIEINKKVVKFENQLICFNNLASLINFDSIINKTIED